MDTPELKVFWTYRSIAVLQVNASKLKLKDYEQVIFLKEICAKIHKIWNTPWNIKTNAGPQMVFQHF